MRRNEFGIQHNQLARIYSAQTSTAQTSTAQTSTAQTSTAQTSTATRPPPRRALTVEPNPDVDVVFTWVDGSDPQHQRAKAQFMTSSQRAAVHASSLASYRWRNNGEILQSILSVQTFAPWVRRVFVVASLGQTPDFSAEPKLDTSRVTVVQDADLQMDGLPVFNSHAIEANLHRIPGLADRFIYMCDDMFFGAPIPKSAFFDRHERPIVFASGIPIPTGGAATSHHQAWLTARMNNMVLLNRVFGVRQRKDCIHQARALTKRAAEYCWSHGLVRGKLQETSRSRFRSPADLEPIGLFCWAGAELGLHQLHESPTLPAGIKAKYVQITERTDFRRIAALPLAPLYCLNDTMSTPTEQHLRGYRDLLARGLPHHRPNH